MTIVLTIVVFIGKAWISEVAAATSELCNLTANM